MKKATSGCLLFLCLVSLSIKSLAQSTEEIIRNHIERIGGETNWNKIKSLVIEGEIKGEDGTVMITKSILKDKAIRNDMLYKNRDATISDNKFYVVLNGNEGWKYLPEDRNNTIYSLAQSEVDQLKETLDYEDPFINYVEKGREINMLGIEYYDSTDFYKFLIQYKTGKKVFCYMNSTSLLIDKIVLIESEMDDMQQFQQYEKLPEGILIAKRIISPIGILNITSIKINPTLPENLFRPSDKNHYHYKH